jgi:ribosome-associated translation inhibitor RaiA
VAELSVNVVAHGVISPAVRDRVEERLAGLGRFAGRPPRTAHVDLRLETNPSLERPAVAKGSIELGDRRYRAHVAAATLDEAIDLLEVRLRRQIVDGAERRREGRREAEPPDWMRGVDPGPRPEFAPRPTDGPPRIVRRKTFALARMSPWEAAADMDDLHHDFYLFTHAGTGRDCLLRRDEEGGYTLELVGPVMDLDSAAARLERPDERLVFFTDEDTGRGNVLYRRYDGHYGLIAPPHER